MKGLLGCACGFLFVWLFILPGDVFPLMFRASGRGGETGRNMDERDTAIGQAGIEPATEVRAPDSNQPGTLHSAGQRSIC